ncbi:MAG: hypothetical protein ACRC7S_07165 [Cetobacterium sp.]
MLKINCIEEVLEEGVGYDISIVTEGLTEEEHDLIIECLENSGYDTETGEFEDIEEIDEEFRNLKEFILGHLYSLESDIENGYNEDYDLDYIQEKIEKYS